MTLAAVRREQAIRQLLREQHEGLTVKNISKLVGCSYEQAEQTLGKMPDTFIDHWVDSSTRHEYVAVWCVVVPPPNCPKPDSKRARVTSADGQPA